MSKYMIDKSLRLTLGDAQKHESRKCLSCGDVHDGASPVMAVGDKDEPKPRPGDLSICLKCGHFMAYDENLQHRELTDAEMYEIAGDPVLIQVSKALHAVKVEFSGKDDAEEKKKDV